jgi:CDP-glucose 4,6-dehydratase
MNAGFWSGRKVFLTGHTGFKGSWLSLWLQQLGAVVYGYSLAPPTDPDMFGIARVAQGMAHELGDIRDAEKLASAMRKFEPSVVLHLAAQPIVRQSYLAPVETYAVNVMGTAHLLEAVRQTPGVQATVIVTSDKCYDNRETIWAYRETDAMGGADPYSSSKGCAELLTASYGRSYFKPGMNNGSLASARAGNVIGGGDWAKDRLVADLMRGLMAHQDVIIRRPHSVRPWQHVLEPLSGYLRVAENLATTAPKEWDGWNFGPDMGSNQTVVALAEQICRHWGRPQAIRIEQDPSAPHEAGLLTLDSTKARVHLNWRPRWNFEHCIAQTVAWYRAYAEKADMYAVSLSQIRDYEQAGSAR